MRFEAVALAFLFCFTTAAGAHQAATPDGRVVDYTGLKKPTGASCCGNSDCAAVGSRWTLDGTLLVQTDRERDIWRPVPPSAIIWLTPTELMHVSDVTHACWRGTADKPSFICVFPETMSS
jgi:hypothetical protein